MPSLDIIQPGVVSASMLRLRWYFASWGYILRHYIFIVFPYLFASFRDIFLFISFDIFLCYDSFQAFFIFFEADYDALLWCFFFPSDIFSGFDDFFFVLSSLQRWLLMPCSLSYFFFAISPSFPPMIFLFPSFSITPFCCRYLSMIDIMIFSAAAQPFERHIFLLELMIFLFLPAFFFFAFAFRFSFMLLSRFSFLPFAYFEPILLFSPSSPMLIWLFFARPSFFSLLSFAWYAIFSISAISASPWCLIFLCAVDSAEPFLLYFSLIYLLFFHFIF